jgi:hypothetical protein
MQEHRLVNVYAAILPQLGKIVSVCGYRSHWLQLYQISTPTWQPKLCGIVNHGIHRIHGMSVCRVARRPRFARECK